MPNHFYFRHLKSFKCLGSSNKYLFLRSFPKDEVLAISDKVVIRADDLLTWIDHGHVWQWGLRAASAKPTVVADSKKDSDGDSSESGEQEAKRQADSEHVPTLKNTQLNFSDVNVEKGKFSFVVCKRRIYFTTLLKQNYCVGRVSIIV